MHFQRPLERPFTSDQRSTTTILFGGLSPQHDRLAEGMLRGLGYRARALPDVSLDALELGKEFGNYGQCNPTHFFAGNLLKHLLELERAGMTRKEIIDTHVFFTAGACGTCRFGMAEAEYRLVLANAGFDGFRVLIFGTDDGIDQSKGQKAGLDFGLDFFLGVVNVLNVGDVLKQFVHQVRPFETIPGSVDATAEVALDRLYRFFQSRTSRRLSESRLRWLSGTRLGTAVDYIRKILDQLSRDDLVQQIGEVRRLFDQVELDRFQVKPVVRLIGEFWAQTTESDGNFNMQRFLEREGAEVSVDRTLFTRLTYQLHMHKRLAADRKGLHGLRGSEAIRRPDHVLAHYFSHYKKTATLTVAERILKRENDRILAAMGGTLHEMVSQYELERLARPYYDWRTGAGESHLEIAENIYYHTHDLCHMSVGIKPFGCMPSTQSDGAQAKVVEDHPGMVYVPIETSGEGEMVAQSRVQMAVGVARARALAEWQDALASVNRSSRDLRAFVKDHPALTKPSYAVPRHPGVVGTAANFALHVGELMARRPVSVSFSAN